MKFIDKAIDKLDINLDLIKYAIPLFILFLILKLTGNIDWSWWLISAPLWIPVALMVLFMTLMFIALTIAMTVGILAEMKKSNKEISSIKKEARDYASELDVLGKEFRETNESKGEE